jgi:predicted MFS family arabinose efflux permease
MNDARREPAADEPVAGDRAGAAEPPRSGSGADDDRDILRNQQFRRLWVANGIRDSAAEVAGFALPITALVVLHARPLTMSLIFACSRLGYLLIGLPAGVWIDRWSKRTVLILADLGYALAFASIPVGYLLGVLTVLQLIAVSLMVSVAGVFFDVAHTSVLPLLLPARRVTDASARLQVSENAIQAVSPSVAGVLTQTVAAPLLYCFTAVCHVTSAVLLRGIRPDPRPTAAASGRRFRREIAEGIRMLLHQPLLRLLLGQAALNNVGAGILLSMMPVFLLREIGVSPVVFGVLATLGAVSGVLASLIAPAIRRRIGEIRMTMVFSALTPVAVLAAPMAAVLRPIAVPLAATAEILIGFVIVGRAVAAAGLRARVTPAEYMGRVTAANSVVTQGATPLGALIGGAVADSFSATTALWVGVAEMSVPIVLLLTSPLRRHRTLPTEWEVR